MSNFEPYGLGDYVFETDILGLPDRQVMVVANRYRHVSVMRTPAEGFYSFYLWPEDLVQPGTGAGPLSPAALYEFLHTNEIEAEYLCTAAWALGEYFSGSRRGGYTHRVLAWLYCVLAARLSQEPGCEHEGRIAANWAAMRAFRLSRRITADLDALPDWQREKIELAAPWVREIAERLERLVRDTPPIVYGVGDQALDAGRRLIERTSLVRQSVLSIKDAQETLFDLKLAWPSVAEVTKWLEGEHPPIPSAGDAITVSDVELCVIDDEIWSEDMPDCVITAVVGDPSQWVELSLCEIDEHTPVRRMGGEEWRRELFEHGAVPHLAWPIPHIVDLLTADASSSAPQLALFLLAYGRLYAGSPRCKRIGKALAKALKSCSDADRATICDRYPEAAALVRTRAKPEALKWREDWALAKLAAIGWGKEPVAVEQAMPAAPVAVAKPAPSRLTPKLQGAGQVKARSNAAPIGVAHRVLEAEWDARVDAMPELMDMTFRWLEDKLGIALTDQWRTGHHEFDHHGFRLETERLAGLFAFRIEHPDARTPGRRWRVEGALIEPSTADGTGAVSIRLIVVDQFKTMTPPPYSMPGLAQRWLATGALSVMERDPREVWQLATNTDYFLFRNTAVDADRPVGFLVTAGECPDIPAQLVGTTVHVHLEPSVASGYAKKFGSAPEMGAVHLFAAKAVQPVVMPFGSREQMEAAVRAATRITRLPSFGDIRQQVRVSQLDTARRQGAAAAAPSASEEHVALPVAMAEHDTTALMDLALSDLDRANEALALAHDRLGERDDELRQALHQIRALKLQLGEDVGDDQTTEQIPDDFEQLPRYAQRLEPRLLVTPKALRSAQAAVDFQDKPLVFRTLDALATHYWEMRFGERDAGYTAWHEFLTANRLSFGPVGHALDNQRFSEAYKVRVDGENLPLDLHLSGSSSRDPTRCLRVYLHADERRRRIVVGHLPSHLPNTHT